jgi:hypothetical protein
LIADKAFTLWFMMLGPVVLLWSIAVLTLDAVRWIIRRASETSQSHG